MRPDRSESGFVKGCHTDSGLVKDVMALIQGW